jgi:hypothetical protein
MMVGSSWRFGDGKPIVLVPPHLGSDLMLHSLSLWLKALGYRPATAGLLCNLGDGSDHQRLVRLIDETTGRVGRRAVLLTHASGLPMALRAAEERKERVSDVIVFDAGDRMKNSSVRMHFLSGWSIIASAVELSRLLRGIGIELIDPSSPMTTHITHSSGRSIPEDLRT